MNTNQTFTVGSLFPCIPSENQLESLKYNTLFRQTLLGCLITNLLQEVYGFNITYVYQKQDRMRDVTLEIEMFLNSSEIDFYVRPMSLRVDVLQLAAPTGHIFDWDFGFTINYPDVIYRNFYSKPFTRPLWNILYGMAFFCSILFYQLKRWEKVLMPDRTRECSYWYELLMVFGAYCQHIPPIEANLLSRRTAYLVFFIFAYVVYTYYTSNLLSHLVNDKNTRISLEELLKSEIDCVILDSVKPILYNNIVSIYRKPNMTSTFQKLLHLRPVSMAEGLLGVQTTKTALLSDYFSIAPYLRTVFTSNEMCNLAQIDVVSNIKKYFYVSKTFPYLEQFKITLLRAKEVGLVNRLVITNFHTSWECTPLTHVQTKIEQIVHPLAILVGAYLLCLIILALEIWHYRRNRIWPYVN